jgi:outer membrane protein OmpA-like peptidoglycan-associated protein
MKEKSVLGTALLGSLAALLSVVSCGGPGSGGGGCHYGEWQGKCALTNVHTARRIERFPTSFVVLEATYEPQSREGVFSPPPFRREITVPAQQEGDLTNHLRTNAVIDCAVQMPMGDACAPTMIASIPPFVPVGGVATGPVGCAKIEQSGNAPVPSNLTMPGPFQFEENDATASPDADKLADAVAAYMKNNPHIECVAIKGKSAPGEQFTLANERAQLVRRLVEARGIDHTRVTVFEATAPTYTASPTDDAPVLPEHRRVYLSVVVYTP